MIKKNAFPIKVAVAIELLAAVHFIIGGQNTVQVAVGIVLVGFGVLTLAVLSALSNT